jgi:hypothetical protein
MAMPQQRHVRERVPLLLRVVGVAALLAWFALLPYVARLPGGLQWVQQYLPDTGQQLWGLLFLGLFNSLPGCVIAAAALPSLTLPRTALVLCFILMSTLTVLAHYNHDLSVDAQAAIWLLVAPVYIGVAGAGFLALAAGGAMLLRRLRQGRGA